jgi:hypothetical protein
MAAVVLFTVGCATIKEKISMASFEKVSEAYKLVMLDSDFESAHGFRDPKAVRERPNFAAYKGLKIIEYEVKRVLMSDDKTEVNQTTEVKYYRIDSLVVRTTRYEQLWKYDDMKKTWLLQTGLPAFK